ncbi:MAG: dihydroorotase [Candidatus Kapabacteria bacterium]|nr:dihydroorotase [Candidatus Kapabacteria bacterium]
MTHTLTSPFDMHIHFRQDEMLRAIAPLSAYSFSGGVIMPNCVPPIDSAESLSLYTQQVKNAIGSYDFTPFMTLFFRNYTEKELETVKDSIIGIKLYPAGATTNSDQGVKEISKAEHTLALMEEMGIRLLVHGETHGFVMDREKEFISIYDYLAKKFPRLHIVMEHITTKEAVDFLDKYDNITATVTLQHLLITLDDVIGGLMNPHLFCKPIAKRYEDRDALLAAALNAHPKLCFGSDSAPHPIDKKESCGCAAGVFTAPIALQVLTQLFEKHDALPNLQKFVSDNAVNIYNLRPSSKKVELCKKPFIVPEKYHTVVPMYAGQTLEWSIESVQ